MIYVLLTDGFEEVEALTPIDIMRRAGLGVKTVAISDNLYVKGSHDIIVKSDINVDEVKVEEMDMLVLPGGPGHVILDNDKNVHSLIDYAVQNDIYIAAICASPSIIGKKGLLAGKKATAFPGFEKYLTGAEVLPDKVVVDGKFITGKGAGASAEFGFTLVTLLLNREIADNLKETMQY